MRCPRIERTCGDCGGEFIATKYARYCPGCRGARQRAAAPRSTQKYVFTEEQDALVRDWYARKPHAYRARLAKLLRIPQHVVGYRAAQLGLTRPKPNGNRPWTEEEIRYFTGRLGEVSIYRLAKTLRRSVQACQYQARRLGLSVRVRDGYTMRSLAECLGTYPRRVQQWVDEGKLPAHRSHGDHYAYHWTDQDVLRFVLENPMDFDLSRVDQTWFMDLLTNGGVLRDALKEAS